MNISALLLQTLFGVSSGGHERPHKTLERRDSSKSNNHGSSSSSSSSSLSTKQQDKDDTWTTCSNHEQDTTFYKPPKVWSMDVMGEEATKSLNRPTAGPRQETALPKGKHPFQLYSMATPNGQKAAIMLEELLALGHKEAEYDAWLIDIMKGDQFGSDFVNKANPNSKIPALLDYSNVNDDNDDNNNPTRVFESCSILLYLAEKFDNAYYPKDVQPEIRCWLFWQVASASLLGGGFGHFFGRPDDQKMEYPINRYTMEVKRQYDVLNRQLADKDYITGSEYTIADICIFTWYGGLALGNFSYGGGSGRTREFLNMDHDYPHVVQWAKRIANRPAVKRGSVVNKTWGDGPKLAERHASSDIDAVLFQQSSTDEQAQQKEQQHEK